MARRSTLLPICGAALAAVIVVRGAARAFVSAPGASAARADGGMAAALAGAAGAAVPLAAFADLPPLEDLPLEELSGTRKFGPEETTFFGISFPVALFGVVCAVTWAAFWVTNLMPAKDKDGTYKTYIGGGMLPPEGYTNPLDPRMGDAMAEEDDPLYEKKGTKSASSAIV